MTQTRFNPWHDVPPGDDAPRIVTGVVEIPEYSKAKFELDKTSGLLKLDRVLYSSVHYPANYGFIPQTYCEDGDPLDILILSQIAIPPLCLVDAKVIGVMEMIDQGESDDKIIAVAYNDMSVRHYDDISNLPEHLLLEMQGFFEDYKKLEKKTVAINSFYGREVAMKIVEESIQFYQREKDKLRYTHHQ